MPGRCSTSWRRREQETGRSSITPGWFLLPRRTDPDSVIEQLPIFVGRHADSPDAATSPVHVAAAARGLEARNKRNDIVDNCEI
jgi:hypothetical protein